MYRPTSQAFADCQEHGLESGSELFVVEGESAAKAVERVRDARFQAVLAMQGKPLNAWKASQAAVKRNALFQKLTMAIGTGWHCPTDLSAMRYQRIILLCDPDADGIHCSVLLLLFFYRWLRPILEAGHVGAVRPPLYEVTIPATRQVAYAYSTDHYQRIRDALAKQRVTDYRKMRFRGLASLRASTLATTCVSPASRKLDVLTSIDAQIAISGLGVSAPCFDDDDNCERSSAD